MHTSHCQRYVGLAFPNMLMLYMRLVYALKKVRNKCVVCFSRTIAFHQFRYLDISFYRTIKMQICFAEFKFSFFPYPRKLNTISQSVAVVPHQGWRGSVIYVQDLLIIEMIYMKQQELISIVSSAFHSSFLSPPYRAD